MKRRYQTDFSSITGNCLQACVASIFNLRLEQVPHFKLKNPSNAVQPMLEWLVAQGCSVVQVKKLHDATLNTICIAAVKSRMYHEKYHAVVGRINRSGKVVLLHDPNKKEPIGKVGKKIDWVTLYFIFRGARHLH